MKNSLIKLSILSFICIFLKRLIFPDWEFRIDQLNTLEFILMVISLIFSFYYWIKVSIEKIIYKRTLAIFSLLLCALIIIQKISTRNETIEIIQISPNEEIQIEQLDRSICIGDLESCTDSLKVTKYKIFQKREHL